MKTLTLLFAIIFAPLGFAGKGSISRGSGGGHGGHITVRGHTNIRGTRMAPSHRTKPNFTRRDSWSTKGNVNPDTGKKGTRTRKK